MRSAARELGPFGVRVNAVAPGAVHTPRIAAMFGGDGTGMGDVIPLGRVALPADIAAALLFLVSDLAGYVTGQTLGVDGGVTANFPFPAAGR
jgi:NAD(P)-dependent dehydrogenase (short-subunit alcohol dehydrogenase family)